MVALFKSKTVHGILLLGAVVVTGVATLTAQPPKETSEPPEGYQQILPRGGIPAINNPKYVSADSAKIDDHSMVLGIVIEKVPVAFSLNLLNSHEVVNDTIGKTNFAAIW